MSCFLHKLSHVLGATFLLALPIGYYPDNPDSTDLMIGVHGGTGQIVSVLRDCSGKAISSEKNTYHDYDISVYALPAARSSIPIVMGLRWGKFSTQANVASRYPDSSNRSWRRTIGYVNPSISFEWRNAGIGFGLVTGDFPASFDRIGDEQERVPFSAHLRLGDVETGQFMVNIMENAPMISGGSIFDVGIAYKVSPHFRGYSGFSAGMYDQLGYLQQARVRASRYVDLDLAMRIGGSAGHLEGSVAGGIVINIGRSATTYRPEPPPEKTRWERLGLEP